MTSRRHRAADITRGLSALIALTAVTAGLPVALYLVAGSPLPHALPALHQVAAALGRRDDGTLFLAVVRYIAWAAWAAWTVSALGEAYGQARGRTIRLAGLGGSRALVTAVLVAFSPAAPAALAAAPAPPPTAAAAPWTGTAAADPAGSAHIILTASTRPAAARTVTVRPGDCLWTIAARYLGNGEKYPEISALNYGRDMGGGQRFTDPALIRPGWVLQLPAAASPPAAAAVNGAATAPRHPGHPSASPAFAQPHPAATTPAAGPTAQAPDASPAAYSPQSSAPGTAPAPSQLPDAIIFISGLLSGGIVVTLAQLRHRQRQQRRHGRRIALPASPAARRAERAVRAADGPGRQAAAVRAALAALADGLRRDRAPLPAAAGIHIAGIHIADTGLDILLTEPAAEPPAPFTVAPGSQDMCWRLPGPALDALPAGSGTGAGDLLPGLVSAGETSDGHLLLDLEAPGVTTVDGTGDLAGQFLAAAAAELATNPWAGTFDLLLEGFPELAAASGRAQACGSLDEAIALLEDRARGIPAGTRPGDARQNRLSDPASPDWTLTLLAARTVPDPGQMARLLDAATPASGIAALVPGDPVTPDGREAPASLDLHHDPASGEVTATVHPLGLVITPPLLDAAAYRALTEILAAARAPDVSPADPPYLDHYLPDPDGQPWQQAAADPTAALLDDDLLLYDGGTPADDDPADMTTPAANGQRPGHGDSDNLSDSDSDSDRWQQEEGILVTVLGPLSIAGTADELQPKHAELVVALALAGPQGLSNEALRGMLGTDEDHPKPADSLRQIITRTRRKLGPAPDGSEYIIHSGNAQYVLHPAAALDWHEFRALADTGRDRRDPRPLRQAVALLRGQPMDGLYYWWVDTTLLETMRAEIVDAAALLAALELDAGDPAAAGRAARAGLAADTAAEQLWRAPRHAEDAAANTAGVHDAWQRCLAAISGIAADGEPHPDTTALYRKLTSRAGAAGRHRR
jgi:DNA-binding SARP family transcriptional activator